MKVLALFGMFALGCGGRVLEEPAGASGVAAPASESSAQGAAPGLPVGDEPEPCARICERDGACGAGQTDCVARCKESLRSSCSDEASAYVQCYAANLEGCAPLPPVCESAYCAYTRCADKVVPSYCR